jgi:putative tricarboxylic transport membrane protein
MMMALGLLVGTVGIDPNSNEQRYTIGLTELHVAVIPLVPMAVGLFGIAQALVMLSSGPSRAGSMPR